MDDCLQILSEQREWDGDDLLVAQVKVQLVIEQVTQATTQSQDGTLSTFISDALRTQLQNIRFHLPDHLRQNGRSFRFIQY